MSSSTQPAKPLFSKYSIGILFACMIAIPFFTWLETKDNKAKREEAMKKQAAVQADLQRQLKELKDEVAAMKAAVQRK